MRGQSKSNISIKAFGPKAILIEWDEIYSPQLTREINQLKQLFIARFEHLKEIVSSYQSLCIYFDKNIDFKAVENRIETELAVEKAQEAWTSNLWEIPVCYDDEFAADMNFVAENSNLSSKEVVEIHSAQDYHVHFIGFMPGFPYLGGLDSAIHCPRLENPRIAVPAGSVGIAGDQTGIYPNASPGGWQLIGHCPVRIFDVGRKNPCLFEAGDTIRFVPITREEHEAISSVDYLPRSTKIKFND